MDFRNLPPLAWLGLALILCGIIFPLTAVISPAIGIGFAVVGIFLIWLSYSQQKRA
jgi:hypothetical protein